MKSPHHWNHQCNGGEVKRVQDCIFSIVQNFSKQVIAGPVDVILALKWVNPMGKSSRIRGWQSTRCCEKCSSECSGKQSTGSARFPHDYSFVTFFFFEGGGKVVRLAFFPSSSPHLHQNASKLNHRQNTWTLPSTAQTKPVPACVSLLLLNSGIFFACKWLAWILAVMKCIFPSMYIGV